MKKIVLLAPTPPPAGGIAAWTTRMLEAKLSNGWNIDVVDEKLVKCDTFGDNSKRKLKSEVKRTFHIFRNLYKKLCDKQVKVIHSCIPSTTFAMIREFICLVLTKLFRRKFIIHFRCTVPVTTNGRIGIFILKLLVRRSDYIIVLNTPSRNFVSNLCDTPCVIIPNFINENEIIEKKITRRNISKVIYVGGVIESKGCIDICKVASKNPSIEFRMIGQPEKKVINYASNYTNVIICGEKSKNEVKEELLNADVFIFLTHFKSEGFSNALAEAMGYGLPCIVSDWAANADMIELHGGFIVPIEDYNKANEALEKMKDVKLREKISEWNIDKCKCYYSSKVIISEYLKVYDELNNIM